MLEQLLTDTLPTLHATGPSTIGSVQHRTCQPFFRCSSKPARRPQHPSPGRLPPRENTGPTFIGLPTRILYHMPIMQNKRANLMVVEAALRRHLAS